MMNGQHYSEKEIQRCIAAVLKLARGTVGNDPQRARTQRLLETLAPAVMQFQMRELNRGSAPDDVANAIAECFGYYVATVARQAAGRGASIERIAEKAEIFQKIIGTHASIRFDNGTAARPKAEAGGHA